MTFFWNFVVMSTVFLEIIRNEEVTFSWFSSIRSQVRTLKNNPGNDFALHITCYSPLDSLENVLLFFFFLKDSRRSRRSWYSFHLSDFLFVLMCVAHVNVLSTWLFRYFTEFFKRCTNLYDYRTRWIHGRISLPFGHIRPYLRSIEINNSYNNNNHNK